MADPVPVTTVEQPSDETGASEAIVHASPFPWMSPLKSSLDELNATLDMCEAMLEMQERGALPNVSLSIVDPIAAQAAIDTGQPCPSYTMAWSSSLKRIPEAGLETLFWTPLFTNMREHVGKLMLDIGELQSFVVDKHAPGAKSAS